MPWMSLIVAYTAAALVATVLCRRLLAGQWWRYARTLLVGTVILLLGDAIAEERSLWVVPRSSGLYVLEIPIETVLIVASTLVNSLLLYLLVSRFLSRDRP